MQILLLGGKLKQKKKKLRGSVIKTQTKEKKKKNKQTVSELNSSSNYTIISEAKRRSEPNQYANERKKGRVNSRT